MSVDVSKLSINFITEFDKVSFSKVTINFIVDTAQNTPVESGRRRGFMNFSP